MRKELKINQLIERYLRNELSEEELSVFEASLKTNESLQNELELQQQVLAGIERIGVKQDIQSAKRKYFNRYNGFYFGSTVLVILACLGYYYFSDNVQTYKARETSPQFNLVQTDSVYLDSTKHLNEQLYSIENNIISTETDSGITPVNRELAATKTQSNFKLPAKEFQYFKIAQNKDTSITGAEGTIISIQANSFTTNATQLTIRLKEYYKMSDMVYDNLSTLTTNNEILETGGMLYLDALSTEGKSLKLKKDKKIKLKFPVTNEKSNMQLFNGVNKAKESVIVWNLVEEESSISDLEGFTESIDTIAPITFLGEAFSKVEKMPRYPTCADGSEKEMQKCSNEEVTRYIKANFKFPKEYVGKNVSGTIYIVYTIDERGFVSNTRLLRGINPLLNKEALRLVNSLPRYTPGKQRGKNVSVQFTIPIKINSKDFEKGYSASEIKSINDSLQKVRKIERSKEMGDILSAVENGASGNQRDNKLVDDIEYYAFASSNLGWINCDRFLKDPREKIQFALTDMPKNSHVRIIFHSTKSLMVGIWEKGGFNFSKLPKGEKITVFAIKDINGVPHLCLQETKISANKPSLVFKEATVASLKEYSERINSIHN